MRDYCTLDLNGRGFAVPLDGLREVIEPPALTPVPLAPRGLCGVVNLRGELLPVLALDPLLGVPTPEAALLRRPWMAVFQAGRHAVGVLTDRVGTLRDAVLEPLSGAAYIEGKLANTDPQILAINLPELIRFLTGGLEKATSFASL